MLFREGRELFKAGRTEEACLKFADSQRLDPSSGTLINLAACHQAEGKLATAWGEFVVAERLAKADGKLERAEEAATRAAQLAPRLPHVRLSAPADRGDATLWLDGKDLGASAFGTSIPLDPGPRQIEVRATGRITWSTSVEAVEGAPLTDVSVPELAHAPPPPKPAPRPFGRSCRAQLIRKFRNEQLPSVGVRVRSESGGRQA